ncbi:hypothetical protein K8089_16085 [Aequorivita sp. F47161]|uniref:Lipoprotein n=1 Tax=Aequorivita vitellina TaxID=2874475 RepID=A0A9X1U4Q6_9FLAO|nr:hypothetical protein [Aequorivita vitellina]MCG2420542.1 hypothetical protein [Aequorivita vitellina]
MLKRNILILLSFLLLISCNNGVNYVPQNDGKSHLIDFDLFSIILPKDFKYKKVDGIDSFVGEIKNGKSKFIFDYGWYSPSPPMNKESFIEDSRKSMDFETMQKFLNQIDLEKYQNEKGEINPGEITKKIKNLTLHKMSDNLIFDKGPESKCEFYYSLEFEGMEYYVSFCIPEENKSKFEFYELKTDTIGKYKRTIALWTDKKNPNISSVNFEPINKETDTNELSIGIKSNMEFDKDELKSIFESVTLK